MEQEQDLQTFLPKPKTELEPPPKKVFFSKKNKTILIFVAVIFVVISLVGSTLCYLNYSSEQIGATANMTNMMNETNMMNKTNMMNMTNMMDMMNITGMMNMMNMTNMSNMTKLRDKTRSGYSCDVNGWDSPQFCKCSPGQRISEFTSNHDNKKEDRQWRLKCSGIIPDDKAGKTRWVKYNSGYINGWDGELNWGAHSGCYMTGMRSYHDNKKEDRRYEVFYSCSSKWVLTSCSDWQWLNSWDGQVKHVLGSSQVITRLYSYHNNKKEDRRFAIKVCDLVPKCDQLVSITYDHKKMTTTENEETVGQGTYDNRGSTSQNSVSASIGWSEQTRLADTYTFSRTSGYSTTSSLEVSLGYNWGVGVPGPSASVTAGFSQTFQTSNTWTRSQTKEYSETHSGGVEFTANCKAGCLCKLNIMATHGKGQLPYTMITKSRGGADCPVEKGVLTVGKGWNANAKSDDECVR